MNLDGLRSLYMDTEHEIKIGDYLASVGRKGIGTRYLVHEVYRVRRHDPNARPRWQMRVEAVSELRGEWSTRRVKGIPRLHRFHWYPRKKRKTKEQEFFDGK